MNKYFLDFLLVLVFAFTLSVIAFKHFTRAKPSDPKVDRPILTCIYCKGTGESVEDVNKTMMQAKIAIWMNHHLMTERCKECVEDGKDYKYCPKAKEKVSSIVRDYEKEGPKFDKTICYRCMGAGSFQMWDGKTKKYYNQKEYEDMEVQKQNKEN